MGRLLAIIATVVILASCDMPAPIIPHEAEVGVSLGFVCRFDGVVILRAWLVLPEWAARDYFDPDTGDQYAGQPVNCSGPNLMGAECRIEPWTDKGSGPHLYLDPEAGPCPGDDEPGLG